MGNTINKVDPFGDNSGVALWQFDGNANDTGGNYNGTWHGTEQYDTGKWEQASKFNGSSYIDFNSYVTCNAISLWCKLSNNNNHQVFFREKSISTDINLCFYKNSMRFYIYDGSNVYKNNTLINYGNWYHIIIVRNSSTSYTFYLNGNDDGNITTSNSLGDSLYLRLSGVKENENYKINGLIDQVRIFNRALTSKEVSYLHNEFMPSKSFARSNIF